MLNSKQKISFESRLLRSQCARGDCLPVFRAKLLKWYSKEGKNFPWRRKTASLYAKVISEVLLQRTRAETVAAVFPAFIKRYPSWKKLALASSSDLRAFLKPLGLWKRRAKSIRLLANEMAKHGGKFSKDRAGVESLTGIGQYIANAIELFAFGRPRPLLDVNMARVLERCFGKRKLADIRYDPYLEYLSRQVVNCQCATEVNWAILDLGAKICRARNPDCRACPMAGMCLDYRISNMGKGSLRQHVRSKALRYKEHDKDETTKTSSVIGKA